MQTSRSGARGLLLVALLGVMSACGAPRAAGEPSIEFVTVPEAGAGGSDRLAAISGRVTGAREGQQIVLFAKSGVWWVQPFTVRPLTTDRRRLDVEEHDTSRNRVCGSAG